MNNIVVSVVCVYNDEKTFENQLEKSLKKQNIEYELIALNNKNGKFSSAAKALNYGAKLAKGDVIIFAHQDVVLKGEGELKNCVTRMKSLPLGTIIGAAGAKEKNKKHFGTYTSGPDYNAGLRTVEWDVMEVSCIDEMFFGMTKETYEMYGFNENICDNWHLYGVEISLHARKEKHSVCVIPIQIHHFSHGRISIGYMKCLKSLVKYYHKDFKYIWTTCFKIPASPIFLELLYIVWYCNRKLRRIGLD